MQRLILKLCLVLILSAQYPEWIDEVFVNDAFSEYLENLIQHPINPDSVQLEELGEIFYFAPDSILRQLKSEYTRDPFFEPFIQSSAKWGYRMYQLYKWPINSLDEKKRGDEATQKIYQKFEYNQWGLDLVSVKQKYEPYFNSNFTHLNYSQPHFILGIGPFRINSGNSLLFSTSYGSFFSPWSTVYTPQKPSRVSSQSSIHKQNVINGVYAMISPTMSNHFFVAFGMQAYEASFETNRFRTFRFYSPESSFDRRETVDEKLALMEYFYTSKPYTLRVTGLHSLLSNVWDTSTDFMLDSVKSSTVLSVYTELKTEPVNFFVKYAYQVKRGDALEIGLLKRNKTLEFEFVGYSYAPMYKNWHSTKLLGGGAFATNEKGLFFRLKMNLSKQLSLYAAMSKSEHLQSVSKNELEPNVSEWVQIGVKARLFGLGFDSHFKKSTDETFKMTLQKNVGKTQFKIKSYVRVADGAFYFEPVVKGKAAKISVAYIYSKENLQKYDYGFQREFRTESYKGKFVTANLFYTFKFTEQTSIGLNYQTRYKLNSDEMETITHSLSCAFHLYF